MKPRLSIGLLSPGWPPAEFANGIVTYVSTIAPQLRAMGHQISILAQMGKGRSGEAVYDARDARGARPAARRGLDALWYRLHPRSAVRAIVRRDIVETARRMVGARKIDLIEMEESFGWASAVRRSLQVPVVVRLHGPWALTGGGSGLARDEAFRWRVRQEGLGIASADAVSAPAQDVLDRVRGFYGLPLAGAEVIPNPLPVAPREERWRPDGCDRNGVLFVGRFEYLKGGDLVVDAFARVLQEIPGAYLTFVGPDVGIVDGGRTVRFAEYVESRIPRALEEGRVAFLGRQPHAALAPLRRRALVTVVCSRYENFPYSLSEAMGLGCPIVAARVGGVPELVRDGENGLLHRPGDAGDLAEKIVTLLRRPKAAGELGARAAIDCERRLAPEVVASRVEALYHRVLGR